MNDVLYENFYDCMVDLGNTLGISKVEDLDIAIKFMDQGGFTEMADYLRKQSLKFAWQKRREMDNKGGIPGDIEGDFPC